MLFFKKVTGFLKPLLTFRHDEPQPSMELQTAIKIAVEAHYGQERIDEGPFILHPIRVMMDMSTDFEKVVAILHDVMEDRRDIKSLDLARRGISSEAIAALNVLNKFNYPDYAAYIEAIAVFGEPAVSVKMADLRDNMGTFDQFMAVKGVSESLCSSRYQKAYVRLRGVYENCY